MESRVHKTVWTGGSPDSTLAYARAAQSAARTLKGFKHGGLVADPVNDEQVYNALKLAFGTDEVKRGIVTREWWHPALERHRQEGEKEPDVNVRVENLMKWLRLHWSSHGHALAPPKKHGSKGHAPAGGKRKADAISAAATGTEPGKKKFAGTCNHCKKKGHKEADCRSKKAGNPPKEQDGHAAIIAAIREQLEPLAARIDAVEQARQSYPSEPAGQALSAAARSKLEAELRKKQAEASKIEEMLGRGESGPEDAILGQAYEALIDSGTEIATHPDYRVLHDPKPSNLTLQGIGGSMSTTVVGTIKGYLTTIWGDQRYVEVENVRHEPNFNTPLVSPEHLSSSYKLEVNNDKLDFQINGTPMVAERRPHSGADGAKPLAWVKFTPIMPENPMTVRDLIAYRKIASQMKSRTCTPVMSATARDEVIGKFRMANVALYAGIGEAEQGMEEFLDTVMYADRWTESNNVRTLNKRGPNLQVDLEKANGQATLLDTLRLHKVKYGIQPATWTLGITCQAYLLRNEENQTAASGVAKLIGKAKKAGLGPALVLLEETDKWTKARTKLQFVESLQRKGYLISETILDARQCGMATARKRSIMVIIDPERFTEGTTSDESSCINGLLTRGLKEVHELLTSRPKNDATASQVVGDEKPYYSWRPFMAFKDTPKVRSVNDTFPTVMADSTAVPKDTPLPDGVRPEDVHWTTLADLQRAQGIPDNFVWGSITKKNRSKMIANVWPRQMSQTVIQTVMGSPIGTLLRQRLNTSWGNFSSSSVAYAHSAERLEALEEILAEEATAAAAAAEKTQMAYDVLHARLAHAHQGAVREYARIHNIKLTSSPPCDPCKIGKTPKRSTRGAAKDPHRASRWYSDLWGPHRTTGYDGSRYVAELVHGDTGYVHVFLIRRKSEFAQQLKGELVHLKSQGIQVTTLRTDCAGELSGKEVEQICANHSIRLETTGPRTKAANSVGERMWRTLLERTTTIMAESGLDADLWPLAWEYAAAVHNVTPRKSRTGAWQSPCAAHMLPERHVKNMRAFGSLAWVMDNDRKGKQAGRTLRGRFVGYDPRSLAYKILVRKGHELVIVTSSHVIFDEFPLLRGEYSGSKQAHTPREETDSDSESASESNSDSESDREYNPKRHRRDINDDESLHENDSETSESDTDDSVSNSEDNESEMSNSDDDQHDNVHVHHIDMYDIDSPDHDIGHDADEPDPESEDDEMWNENFVPIADIPYEPNYVEEPYDDYDSPWEQPTSESSGVALSCSLRLIDGVDDDIDSDDHVEVRLKKLCPLAYAAKKKALRQKKVKNIIIPRTLEEARNSIEWPEWLEALKKEACAIIDNNTFEVVIKPKGRKTIKSRYVFDIKTDENGEISRYKCRLVAKGYTQVAGIDYESTFSPVVSFTAVRSFIASAAHKGHRIFQCDVNTAFLNAALEEELYLDIPDGMKISEDVLKRMQVQQSECCLRLRKSLYGLKQASREWYRTLNDWLTSNGWEESISEPCLYKKHDLRMIVYVDDILISGQSQEEVTQEIKHLGERFKIKELGEAKWILGVRVERHSDGSIEFDHSQHIKDALEKLGVKPTEKAGTPTIPTPLHQDLESDALDKKEHEKYREIIGVLNYIALVSRPDISWNVSRMSKYLARPTRLHMNAAKRCLHYLNETVEETIMYRPGSGSEIDILWGYCDADFAGYQDSMQSTTGYVCVLCEWRTSRMEICTSEISGHIHCRIRVHCFE